MRSYLVQLLLDGKIAATALGSYRYLQRCTESAMENYTVSRPKCHLSYVLTSYSRQSNFNLTLFKRKMSPLCRFFLFFSSSLIPPRGHKFCYALIPDQIAAGIREKQKKKQKTSPFLFSQPHGEIDGLVFCLLPRFSLRLLSAQFRMCGYSWRLNLTFLLPLSFSYVSF